MASCMQQKLMFADGCISQSNFIGQAFARSKFKLKLLTIDCRLTAKKYSTRRMVTATQFVLVVVFGLFLSVLSQAQSVTGERIALVVGNAAYKDAPLVNPTNDAKGMAHLLEQAGFKVNRQIDATQEQLRAAVVQFGAAIRSPKVKFALFYYAGHGVQLDWRNYLIPVNVHAESAEEVRQQSVDVSDLIGYMQQTKGKNFLIILDACRDDPFAGAYQAPAKGLSQFDAPAGSLLAFSTSPGSVAMDGEASNGLYTGHLIREFSVRGAKLEDAFKRVRLNVRLESKGLQIPWESTSLEDDIYLFESDRKKLSDEEQDALLEREIAAWRLVKSSNDPNKLADFIRQYPSGATSELAQSRLNRSLALLRDKEPKRSLWDNPFKASFKRATWALGTPAPVIQSLPSTPYYKGFDEHHRQYSIGDRYEFSVINGFSKTATPLRMQVTAIDLEQDRIEYNQGEYVSDTMGNILKNLRGSSDTPRQFYPAELFLGKKWHTRFKQVRPGGLSYTFDYALKVVGKERISVPAGTFDTYKIEARGFNVNLGASLERNIWVSPGINADIVHETMVRLRSGKIDQYERQELVHYQVADGAAVTVAVRTLPD